MSEGDLPENHPFKDSQTLRELRGKGAPPEFRRIFVMTVLLAVALGVIAWQASKRASQIDTGPSPEASTPKEGTPLAQDDAANRAFAEVGKLSEDEVASRVRPEVGVKELLNDPEGHPGAWVHVSGIPIAMSADKLEPNPAGIAEAWRTYVVDRRTREAVCLWTLERPREWDEIVLCHDVLESDGLFVRLVTYTTQDGKKRTAPLVVSRSLSRFVIPEDTSVRSFQWAIGAMIALVGVALVVLVLQGKREEARHKERLREALGPVPPRAPEPPAEGGSGA